MLIGARKVGRPVRWSAERTESFLADDHGRDMITPASLRSTRTGRSSPCASPARRTWAAICPSTHRSSRRWAGSRIFGGVYRIPKAFTNIKGYYSNTAPVDAYRGAGRPEAAYLMER